MPSDEFEQLVKDIKSDNKEFKITPRKLIGYFNFKRRTWNNQSVINKYIEKNKLEVIPSYITSWIDGDIIIKHKKKAHSKVEADPIQRLQALPAANNNPVSVKPDAKLSEAVTLMMMNNYSQLPVVKTGGRDIVGVISWEAIGCGLANKQKSENVKDYISNEFITLGYDTPLLDAIPIIINKGFVLVQKQDKTLSGIVTTSDMGAQFLTMTEPFLIIEQIEINIRKILDGKLLLEEIQNVTQSNNPEKLISSIDDLTFGEYIRLIENPEHWKKLNLSIDRVHFVNQLKEINKTRNEIMHFEPEGTTPEQLDDLRKMTKFLQGIGKYL